MQKTEVLSPVGNMSMLVSAVRSGADAVYFGLNSFNARRNAENFTLYSLKEAVEYCHIRGVKAYLTLNICVGDKEMKEAISQTIKAAKYGIDAVIVADIGFAKVLHTVLPDLEIHASTQMTVHSPSAIKPLKEMGFSRVVVSREMSKPELAEFCDVAKAQGMEVEVFVHGALCMCMSGQCLLSAMLGGRSGNRGLCAGPCRLPFGVQNSNGYDLSLKDLSLIKYLPELKSMGVCSFKIEGRMKRPEYVSAATSVCRDMLDCGYAKAGTLEALENVFSRSGFTDGYYKGKLGKEMFGIRTKDDVVSSDSAFSYLHSLYRNERQSVSLMGSITVKENIPISLTLTDGVNAVTVLGDIPEKAVNRPIIADTLKEQIGKLGGTPYKLSELNIELGEGVTVRGALLNALRREAVESLSYKRYALPEIREKAFPALQDTKRQVKNKTYIRLDNINQLTEKALKCYLVILPIDADFSKIQDYNNIAVELPRGISNESYILSRLEEIFFLGIKTALCGTLAATELAQSIGFNTVSDFGFNIYNSYSLEYHKEKGAVGAVASPELLLSDIKKLKSTLPIGLIAYGRLPLMLTRNCPVKNGTTCENCKRQESITDRKNESFPIRCRNGYSELLNSKVIWLADKKETNDIDFKILYFTDETPDRVDRVIDAYSKGLSPDCEFTRGLYYRGVE